MDTRRALGRILAGREVAAAFGLLAVLYLARHVQFRPLQLLAYLLVVAYDLVEVALPALTPYHPVGFPVFLYVLAVVGGWLARRSRPDERSVLRRAAGGVCLVVGAISLGIGAYVGGPLIAPADNPTPLAITGTTGVVLLAVGWLLLAGRRPFG